MNMDFFSAVFFSVLIVAEVLAQEPGNAEDIVKKLHKCYNNDKPQFDKCLTDFFVEIRPYLVSGIKEMNVPPLEPMFVDRADFPKDSSLIQGTAYFYNMSIHGVGDYSVISVTTDIPKHTITLRLTIPSVDADAEYKFDGSLLVLPVNGDGKAKVQLFDNDVKIILYLERDGTELRIVKAELDFTTKKLKFRLENLLGGKEVGEAINNLLNDNSMLVLTELKPLLSRKLADALVNVIANIAKKIPSEAFIVVT